MKERTARELIKKIEISLKKAIKESKIDDKWFDDLDRGYTYGLEKALQIVKDSAEVKT